MNLDRFRQHYEAGLISEDAFKKVTLAESNRTFSVHWELRTLLYLGVLLFTTGLGILVYKHIDTIGHDVIIAIIAISCAGSFYYALKHKPAFAWTKVQSPKAFYDYVVLLGCTLFVTLIAYLQFRYAVFGSRYGLALAVPMVVLFACAYTFDHLGILSMAITNLGAWVGVALTPLRILQDNAFNDPAFLLKAIALSMLLLVLGYVSNTLQRKPHFAFTYEHFGIHLFFIATYVELYQERPGPPAWFILMAAGAFYVYRLAMRTHSFYFLLLIALYMYVAVSTLFLQFCDAILRFKDVGEFAFVLLYFIGSAVALIVLLVRWHKKLKTNDRVQ